MSSRIKLYDNQAFSLWSHYAYGVRRLDVHNHGGCQSCLAEEDSLDVDDVRSLIAVLQRWADNAEDKVSNANP
ncbi:MAG: hypothetical protein IPL79_20060 [Myxococcales bacterium]|nr:hypothetical protein [Myxococcales bacterium]